MRWAVATIKSNAHARAVIHLARQGFDYYNPMISRRVRVAHRRFQDRRFPLFPGYIFVAVIDRWRALLSTIGVMGVVMQGGKPATVSDAVVNNIRAKEVDGVFVVSKERFARGQKVQIGSGPFLNEFVIYDGMRGKDRVAVLHSLLGRVIVDEDGLTAA